ncbi:hypothetical protein [Sedimenticola hydrogenitrophicus]|uniref:hypothetical protein n=1 Tax=Sedimenticola hydrogenitrophicus TaxID=2967975 RepID=UPI0021A29FA8|nr:hypothetical protein [Sedimenticola hydrogenitrophicus]
MTAPQVLDNAQQPPFRPLRLVAVVLLILLGISGAAQWYSRNVTLPRYCEDPATVLERVHRLLTEAQPAGEGDRKPYIIAARLTFLIPRGHDEPLTAYLNRLQRHMEQQCR